MPEMSGADFVALVRLTDRPGNVLAAPGQTCERVPAEVLASMERRGKIRRIERPRLVRKPVLPAKE